jgi:hypothetical protein
MRAIEEPCIVARSALRWWILTLLAAAAWTIASSGTAFAQHWKFGTVAPGRPSTIASGSSQRAPAMSTPAGTSRATVTGPSARSAASFNDVRAIGAIPNLSLTPIMTSFEREASVSGVEDSGGPQPVATLGNSIVVTLNCHIGFAGTGVSWDWGLSINRSP